MKIKEFLNRITLWFKTQFKHWGEFIITPIRMFSIMLVLLVIFWEFIRPVDYFSGGAYNTYVCEIMQVLVAICGIFGLMGNGKTAKIRASIVSMPFLYLATLYVMQAILQKQEFAVIGIIVYGLIGLWLAIFGYRYERDAL
jgi:hypothetical protein